VSFEEIEPWPEPVDGAQLLNDLAKAIRTHVVISDHCRDICALWVIHTYLIMRFKISPKFSIRSAARRCGKTTLLEVLAELVFRALVTGSITTAALFRVIDKYHATLLIDEVDTFVGENEELKGILNGSHRYDGAVIRTVGEDHEPRRFSVYAAVALSGIGGLAATLADRSVPGDLQRRRPNERIERLRIGRMGHLHELRRRITRWVADHKERIAERDPDMPGIIDREADNWHVLLAIADEAEGEWPERARKAAEAAHVAAANDPGARLELLLRDIRGAFVDNKGTTVRDMFGNEQVVISSAALVKALVGIEGSPWAETGKSRKPLTQNGLARMLKEFGVAPKKVGPKDARVSGYALADFEDAFARYLEPLKPLSDDQSASKSAKGGFQPDNRTPSDGIRTFDDFKADTCPVEKWEKSNNGGAVSECPVEMGKSGQCAPDAALNGGDREQRGQSYTVLGASPAGERCTLCGKAGGDRIRYRGHVNLWHQECADKFIAALANPPVKLPDLGPDPLDEHGAPHDGGEE
jgi:hypothetical protein